MNGTKREVGMGIAAAAARIIGRPAGRTDVATPPIALAEYEVPAYPAGRLPPELAAIPPVKPGSRNMESTSVRKG
jgi:orotate phosphoribosyltransferase